MHTVPTKVTRCCFEDFRKADGLVSAVDCDSDGNYMKCC